MSDALSDWADFNSSSVDSIEDANLLLAEARDEIDPVKNPQIKQTLIEIIGDQRMQDALSQTIGALRMGSVPQEIRLLLRIHIGQDDSAGARLLLGRFANLLLKENPQAIATKIIQNFLIKIACILETHQEEDRAEKVRRKAAARTSAE